MDLAKIKKIYMIGIKGVGMTMLAQFLKGRGYIISGSDGSEVFMTDKVLRDAKIKVISGFSGDNIPLDVELIVYSSAYNEKNNVEMARVFKDKKLKNIALNYAAALGQVFSQYYGIAVCGSHGKTTTSAWLGYVLKKAGLDPSVLVGSRVPQFKGSSLVGKSKYFVAESDEYQNKLQYFGPQGVLLNNIDYDHPDFFKTEADYVNVFKDFIKKIPAKGFLVANIGDKFIKKIIPACAGKVLAYSSDMILSSEIKNGRQHFKVKGLGEFTIRLLGEHNILNALAVILASKKLGIPLDKIRKYLGEFSGTERRSQILGKYNGALIIDDYAHHPTEIKATLSGLRQAYKNKKLITVFHPHTFTRTKALLNDFSQSFKDTNKLIVLDIYGSAREKQGGVSSKDLVKKIVQYNLSQKNLEQGIIYIPNLKEVENYLRENLNNKNVVILMGAGDVFRVGAELLRK